MDNLEIRFNIRDLFRRIFKAWKLILILALVFCVLLCGYFKYENTKILKSAEEPLTFLETYDIKNEDGTSLYANFELRELASINGFTSIVYDEDGLSEKNLGDINSAIAKYKNYQDAIVRDNDYVSKTLFFGINSQRAPKETLTYAVSINGYRGQEESSVSNTIMYALQSKVVTNTLKENIITAIGWNTEPKYMDNLFYFRPLEGANGFAVEITSTSKGNAEKMSVLFKEAMEKAVIELQNGELDYSLNVTLVSEEYTEGVLDRITELKKPYTDRGTTYAKARDNVVNELDPSLSPFYSSIIRLQARETEEDKELSNEEFIAKYKEPVQTESVMKGGVYGLVIGVFISLCYLVIKYLFQKQLRRPEDMVEVFNVPLFATLKKDSKDMDIKMAIKDIELSLKARKGNAVYIDSLLPEESEIVDEVVSGLTKAGLKVFKKENSEKTLDDLSISDACVLISKVDKTKYADIYNATEIAKRFNKAVVGSVVLK